MQQDRRVASAGQARSALVAAACGAAALLWLAAPPVTAWSTLTAAVAGSTGTGGDGVAPLVAALALAAWALVAEVVLTVVLTVGALVPGGAGRAAAAVRRRTVPAALRRVVEVGLGVTVTLGVAGAAPAFAASAPVPRPSAVAAASPAPTSLDWSTPGVPDLDWADPVPVPSSAPTATRAAAPVVGGAVADSRPSPTVSPSASASSAPPAPGASASASPSTAASAPAAPSPGRSAPASTGAVAGGEPAGSADAAAAAHGVTTVPGPSVGAPTAADIVVVRPGDSLWQLAERDLTARDGAAPSAARVAAAWPGWWAANRDTVGADPDLVLPGQVLHPPADGAGHP